MLTPNTRYNATVVYTDGSCSSYEDLASPSIVSIVAKEQDKDKKLSQINGIYVGTTGNDKLLLAYSNPDGNCVPPIPVAICHICGKEYSPLSFTPIDAVENIDRFCSYTCESQFLSEMGFGMGSH